MALKSKQLLMILGILAPLCVMANSSVKQIPSVPDQLGWMVAQTDKNLCGGYYSALPIFYVDNPLAASQQDNYDWGRIKRYIR